MPFSNYLFDINDIDRRINDLLRFLLFLIFAINLGCEDKPSSLIGQSLTVYSSFELNLNLYSYTEMRWVNLGYCEKSKPNVFVQLPSPPWALAFNQDGERILISEYQNPEIDLSFVFNGSPKKSNHFLIAIQLNIAQIEDLKVEAVAIANGRLYPLDGNILRAPIHEEVTILGIWRKNNRTIYYSVRTLTDLYYYQNDPLNLVPQKVLNQQIPFIGSTLDFQLATGEWVYQGVRTGLIVDQGLVNQNNGLLVSVPNQQAIDWGIWFRLSSQHLQFAPIEIKDQYASIEAYVPAQNFGVKSFSVSFDQQLYPTLGSILTPTPLNDQKIEWQNQGVYVDLSIYNRKKQGIRIISPIHPLDQDQSNDQSNDQTLVLNRLKLPPTI